jgi:hypothetical protein
MQPCFQISWNRVGNAESFPPFFRLFLFSLSHRSYQVDGESFQQHFQVLAYIWEYSKKTFCLITQAFFESK